MTETITTQVAIKKPKAQRKPKNVALLITKPRQKSKRKPLIQALTYAPVKIKKAKTLLNRIGVTDKLAAMGTESMLRTLFSGISGIDRGIAFGSDTTAICKFRGALDYVVSASGQLNFTISPCNITSSQWITTCAGLQTAFAGNVSPYFGGPGTTITSTAGPFSVVNPSLGWRVVRTSIRITPTTNALNQGGVLLMDHLPIMYSTGPISASFYTGPTTVPEIENVEMMRTFSGLDKIVYQWFPNQDEIDVSSSRSVTIGTNVGGYSGMHFAYFGPSSAGTNLHIEYELGIEYVPTASYRPFVDRKLPGTHPDALFFMNQFVSKHWEPAVMGTLAQWTDLTSSLEHMSAAHTASYSYNNRTGNVADMGKRAVYEESKSYTDQAYDVIGEAVGQAGAWAKERLVEAAIGTATGYMRQPSRMAYTLEG